MDENISNKQPKTRLQWSHLKEHMKPMRKEHKDQVRNRKQKEQEQKSIKLRVGSRKTQTQPTNPQTKKIEMIQIDP